MFKKVIFAFKVLLCAVLIFQIIGCGTIMHPRRIGQKSGNIDPVVAILDGVCLLFFIVPGVVAFAVDFINGTIYLPHGRYGMLDINNADKVSFDPKKCTLADIEKIVKEKAGYDVDLNKPEVKVYAFNTMEELRANLAYLMHANEITVAVNTK